MVCLSRCSDYVDFYSKGTEGVEESVSWRLKWHKKMRQYAIIDAIDGKVEEFYLQSGAIQQKADPNTWLAKIDRRINYLWHKHRIELKEIIDEYNFGGAA